MILLAAFSTKITTRQESIKGYLSLKLVYNSWILKWEKVSAGLGTDPQIKQAAMCVKEDRRKKYYPCQSENGMRRSSFVASNDRLFRSQ